MNGEYVLSIAKDKVLAADNTKNEYLPAYNSGVIKVDDQDRPTIASVQKVHASQYKVKLSEPVKSLTGANFSAKYVADGTTLSVGTTDVVLDTTDLQLKGELLVNLNTAVKSNKEIELKLVGAVDWNNNHLSPNPASISLTKYMKFVFLGPVFCRQLPSDSASPRTPLLLANLYFCLRGSGLTPYSSCTCRAHKETRQHLICLVLLFNLILISLMLPQERY